MKDTDTKIVNVYAPRSGGSFLTKLPFSGSVRRRKMTIHEIKQCLFAKMKVEELVGDKIIPLDLANYNVDHTGKEKPAAASTTQAKKPANTGKVISLDKNGKPIKEPVVKNKPAQAPQKQEEQPVKSRRDFINKK